MATRVSKNHKVFNIAYHVTWIPKYRKHILKGDIKVAIEKYLLEKANNLNVVIETYEIMDDHVHLFIRANPNIKLSYIVQQLKGYVSFKVRQQFPELQIYKSLWSHSYFAETIGYISENSVKKYINMQQLNKKIIK
jgi:putative transposase